MVGANGAKNFRYGLSLEAGPVRRQKAFALSGDTTSLCLPDGWHNFDELASEILGSDSDA